MLRIMCLVLVTSGLGFKSVLQVTCPKSCSTCQCSGCKNISVSLGKCAPAGQGAAVVGSCSEDGSKFTEEIYLNAKCQGQAATRSVINTDACIQASETKKYIAFFCMNDAADAEKEESFDVVVARVNAQATTWTAVAPSRIKNIDDAMPVMLSRQAQSTLGATTNKDHYGDPAGGCKSDEIGGSLTGMEDYQACYPKCLQYNNCPTDLPDGATVHPGITAYGMCLLNGPKPEYSKHCMLMCKGVFGEAPCPAPSVCVAITGYEFSLCQYPVNSSEVANGGDKVKVTDACDWATKCINSENQCQPCNKSPFAGDDRCVCGPGSADWIKKGECKACANEPTIV